MFETPVLDDFHYRWVGSFATNPAVRLQLNLGLVWHQRSAAEQGGGGSTSCRRDRSLHTFVDQRYEYNLVMYICTGEDYS